VEERTVAFQIDFAGPDKIAALHDAHNRLEIAPAIGFNAYRWTAGGNELLFHTDTFLHGDRPTRSGIPVLFPFPNRIRDGQFMFDGKSYQLPLDDPAGKNAIHGFAFNRPWRIVDHGADQASAWITGEFHGSHDAPETLSLWPADYRLRVTYRLFDHVLRIEADADNPDTKPLPFGLGYHPYFALAPLGGEQAIVTVPVQKIWELAENLPTGMIVDVDEARDLHHGQSLTRLHLDDVMTDVQPMAFDPQDQLGLVGVIQHPSSEHMLTLWTSNDYREMVAFTPPHRQAICLEPYTCATDAVNLTARGIDAGWRVLQPGEHWHGVIEIHLSSS
jgi:aldose 1-epimerase